MIESELARKTLREEMEALGDLRSHIQNLDRICSIREEKFLQRMIGGRELKRLREIIQLYRSTCSAYEPAWDNFQEIQERAQFWYHIGRLRVVCQLWKLRRAQGLCCAMALGSLQALEVLTPGFLDVL